MKVHLATMVVLLVGIPAALVMAGDDDELDPWTTVVGDDEDDPQLVTAREGDDLVFYLRLDQPPRGPNGWREGEWAIGLGNDSGPAGFMIIAEVGGDSAIDADLWLRTTDDDPARFEEELQEWPFFDHVESYEANSSINGDTDGWIAISIPEDDLLALTGSANDSFHLVWSAGEGLDEDDEGARWWDNTGPLTSISAGNSPEVIEIDPTPPPRPPIAPTTPLRVELVAPAIATTVLLVAGFWWLRNHPYLLLPLYTKMSRQKALDKDVRQTIFEHINNNHGIHFRALLRELKLGTGVLVHHLAIMERAELVQSRRVGPLRRYYPQTVMGTKLEDTDISDRERAIIAEVVKEPGISQAHVAEALGLSRQTVNYQVRKLLAKELLRQEKTSGRRSVLLPGPRRRD